MPLRQPWHAMYYATSRAQPVSCQLSVLSKTDLLEVVVALATLSPEKDRIGFGQENTRATYLGTLSAVSQGIEIHTS